jgi:hypothetical protein
MALGFLASLNSTNRAPLCKMFHTILHNLWAMAQIALIYPRRTTRRLKTDSRWLPLVLAAA